MVEDVQPYPSPQYLLLSAVTETRSLYALPLQQCEVVFVRASLETGTVTRTMTANKDDDTQK
jgi:hypothetical protein